MRVVIHILYRYLNKKARPYLDDIVIKCNRTDTPKVEVLLGVRKYILEHL